MKEMRNKINASKHRARNHLIDRLFFLINQLMLVKVAKTMNKKFRKF